MRLFATLAIWALVAGAQASPLEHAGCDAFPEAQEDAVQRFAQILRFKTTSTRATPNHANDTQEFLKLHDWLQQTYSEVYSKLKVERVGVDQLSLLITWPGSQPDLLPALFISHLDVVPVPEESLQDWVHPPFDGVVADGYVWGRGAMDVKVTVIGLLEAATALLKQGWQPMRTLMFAFGQDEEVSGDFGAGKTAELLRQRGVELDIIWDEGAAIVLDGVGSLLPHPVALVATAEKGYQSVEVHIRSEGGHSSMPPTDGSSVGAIAGRILTALDSSPPLLQLTQPIKDFLKSSAAYAPAWIAPLLSLVDRAPFSALIARALAAASPATAALVRTTAAATRFQAGVADNVLPQQGLINVNFRLLPGHPRNYTVEYLRSVIPASDLKSVELRMREDGGEASAVSPANGTYFRLLAQAIQEQYSWQGQPIPVLPFMLSGMTDSRNYRLLPRNGILRFMPIAMNRTGGDVGRVHGTNERLAVEQLPSMLCFLKRGLELFGSHAAAGAAEGRSRRSHPAEEL